ncbi:MAG TPA: FHA domain-containing protein [Aggregatilineales bacterium]|nr:FHA domain-containing protein [Anaerolineales bacterium]HRE46316.1 FHA domain-containing protein [Aggregatilineales bacterium]
MTVEIILIVLRIAGALALIAFLSALFALLWRDMRLTAREVESRTQKRGRLVILTSEDATMPPGVIFPLLPLTRLGRAPTNTIRLSDSGTSSEHAILTLRGGQWWLEDRKSRNGTLLNGHPVLEPVVVTTGDVIGVGLVTLRLELE